MKDLLIVFVILLFISFGGSLLSYFVFDFIGVWTILVAPLVFSVGIIIIILLHAFISMILDWKETYDRYYRKISNENATVKEFKDKNNLHFLSQGNLYLRGLIEEVAMEEHYKHQKQLRLNDYKRYEEEKIKEDEESVKKFFETYFDEGE